MKVVIQRVSEASVTIEQNIKSTINNGLLVLLGVGYNDSQDDIDWLVKKVANLRIFADEDGVMNKSIIDVEGDVIVVSQFTLMANTKKGNRPSYIEAASPDVSVPLYKAFVSSLSSLLDRTVLTGEFGANMQVSLINDGPVTIIIDSKNK